ncbi:unnamed protein product [Microthlaspi erraticum]|uniref:Uncharacterized protein n=1 Tax=Microthlaspi erraticum TaxID=1685480 RepID=A0A6D2IGT7_9BRAS|nr:unnamed protein product [Microthlaspi erraticum]
MSASVNDLEKKLLEAGEELLNPLGTSFLSSESSSDSRRELFLQYFRVCCGFLVFLVFLGDLCVNVLVPVFDDNSCVLLQKLCLSLPEVEQDPPNSTQKALSPLKNALVSERLFKNSNVNVRVAVASCIIEIMRITAPNAPYDDDKMREVFGLVVSSFEHLANKSNRSYSKRTSILKNVALHRVPVVMLDLDCDALLIDMFQHFLKALRDHHPMIVYSHMEIIMTLVLEESEDIPPGLLSPILSHLKKDDKKIPQVSRRLAEQVLINCAIKLKTYLNEAVKSSGVSLDKCCSVVASICEGTFIGLKQNEVVAQQNTHNVDPEKSCGPKKIRNLEKSLAHNSSKEADPAETEAQIHKRARFQSCNMLEKTISEAEGRVPQPCSVTLQLAKVKQSIVDTITSVRQFRSELKKKEDNLEASLLEVDILGEKILGVSKILNS